MAYTDEQRAYDYKIVFGSDLGRKVLDDILRMGHVYAVFPLQSDPFTLGISAGENNLAKRIAAYVGYDPSVFVRHGVKQDD